LNKRDSGRCMKGPLRNGAEIWQGFPHQIVKHNVLYVR
jgi:hypothetical protein